MSQQASQNFVAAQAFEAAYEDTQGQQNIMLELRFKADESCLLFTIVRDEPVYASSIHDFVLKCRDCTQLSIGHNLFVLWNGISKPAQLVEHFIPNRGKPLVIIKTSLFIDGIVFESTDCDTLQDAIGELHDLTDAGISWQIKTCYHCKFCYLAFLGPQSDRDDYRCYRDAPEAFAEVQERGYKFASRASQIAGSYFVNAFHTCAAWEPSIPK